MYQFGTSMARITIPRTSLIKVAAITGITAFGFIALDIILKLLRRRKRQRKVWRSIRSDCGRSQQKVYGQTRIRPSSGRKLFTDSVATSSVKPSHSEDIRDNGSLPSRGRGDEMTAGCAGKKGSELTRMNNLWEKTVALPEDDDALVLCNRGLEFLEEALHYWEEALTCVSQPPEDTSIFALPTKEESLFVHRLESLLEHTINLQDECDGLLRLHRKPLVLPWKGGDDSNKEVFHRVQSDAYLSVISDDSEESYESAVEDVLSGDGGAADRLEDWVKVSRRDALSVLDSQSYPLYHCGVIEAEHVGVTCRAIRTKLLGCTSDLDYLAKLHALRLTMEVMFRKEENLTWFQQAGKELIVELLIQSDRDPGDFSDAFQTLLNYVEREENWEKIGKELKGRGVVFLSFYDIVLDFIVMDAFDDLNDPPAAVSHVLHNRWLSNGFKETSLNTAIWSVYKAKRQRLMFSDGFISHFYSVTEHLSGMFAWGLMGPDTVTKQLCSAFKDTAMAFLTDLFDVEEMGYLTLEETADNIMTVAKKHYDRLLDVMAEISTTYDDIPIDDSSLI